MAFVGNGEGSGNSLIVNLWRTKVMVCARITKDGLSNGNVCPYVSCSLRLTNFYVYNVFSGSMEDVLE